MSECKTMTMRQVPRRVWILSMVLAMAIGAAFTLSASGQAGGISPCDHGSSDVEGGHGPNCPGEQNPGNGTDGFIEITQVPDVTCIGTSATVKAFVYTKDSGGNKTGIDGVNVQFSPGSNATTQNGGIATVSATWSNAGNQYIIADGGTKYGKAWKTIKVVEVASLKPAAGKKIGTTQTGPNNDDTDVWLVPWEADDDPNAAGPFVSVNATPSPNVATADLPNCWSLRKGESGSPLPVTDANSDGEDDTTGETKVLAKVNSSNPGSTLIIAKVGTSEKRVLGVVVRANLELVGIDRDPATDGPLPEGSEENPGAYLAASYNYDKEDPALGDQEKLHVSIGSVANATDQGTVTIEVLASDGSASDKARIWERNGTSGSYTWTSHDSKFTIDKADWDQADWGDPAKNNPTLFVEGVDLSDSERDVDLKLTYERGSFTGTDKVAVTVRGVDLDIDSDNNNEFDNPSRSSDEDSIEDASGDSDHPGKIIIVNDGDHDTDGIPDYADGFNQFGGDSANPPSDNDFVPLILQLPPGTDLDKAELTITYSASNPADVTRSGTAPHFTYSLPDPANEKLRIWTKDGTKARTKTSVADGGDYVESGSYSGAKLKALGFSSSNLSVTLYVEAVSRSLDYADLRISATVDPDGSAGPAPSMNDAVRVTSAILHAGMDGNRDGTIDFSDPRDLTYLFWVNDDHDYLHHHESMWQEDDGSGAADCDDDTIGHVVDDLFATPPNNCLRDLEDFTQLHLQVDGLVYSVPNVKYYLEFDNAASGSPKANLFEAVNGTFDYLSNRAIAVAQAEKTRMYTIASGTPSPFDASYIMPSGGTSAFLLEGAAAGKGDLTLVAKQNGKVIGKRHINLDLRPITKFYEKYNVDLDSSGDANAADNGEMNHPTYTPSDPNEYFLFVHGYNMEQRDKDRWAETCFKRLWWRGYKGRVGCFQWPTVTGTFAALLYNRSAYQAWTAGHALRNRLNALNASHPGSNISVLAHSQGNVVMGEALYEHVSSSPLVHTYIASQPAVSASCYDNTVAPYHDSGQPDVYGFYTAGVAPALPYMEGNHLKADHITHYWNAVDYALGWWETDNRGRPNLDYSYHDEDGNDDTYDPAQGDNFWYSHLLVDQRELTFPNDRFEIFAWDLDSGTTALGRVENISGLAGRSLADWDYDDAHYSHSREFRSNIVDELDYWSAVMTDCGY